MQVIPTIGILVFRDNCKEVLLVKNNEGSGHPTGIYGTPAGRIDSGETAAQAAVRELKEETGLETSEKDLVRTPYDFGVTEIMRKQGTIFCTWEVFVCKITAIAVSEGVKFLN